MAHKCEGQIKAAIDSRIPDAQTKYRLWLTRNGEILCRGDVGQVPPKGSKKIAAITWRQVMEGLSDNEVDVIMGKIELIKESEDGKKI
jgi:hypothetical protein